MEELALEAQISPLPPVVLGCVLVVLSVGERVLPDANVWLYLYSPAFIGLDARIVDAYANANAWDTLLNQGAVACIDPIVISEVINRLLDEEWLRLDAPDLVTRARRYRQSPDYMAASFGNGLEKIGHLYPKVKLLDEQGGGEANVDPWFWVRTVASQDPAASLSQF